MKNILSLSLIFGLTIIASLFISFGGVRTTEGVEGTDGDPDGAEIMGFAWSSNIGHLSFNVANCDLDDDGVYESGAPTGCPTSGPAYQYSVIINEATGILSGYAWSNNIGWVTFNSSSLTGCPMSPCIAKLTGTNFSGWARALSGAAIDSDDWDGWIRLSGTGYGFTLSGEDINGTAWGGDVIGWIDSNTLSTDFSDSCANGIDDDNDGVMDEADPDCDTGGPEINPDPQCNNDFDDDADGLIDYGPDPGCSSLTDNSEADTSETPEVELLVGIGDPAFTAINLDEDGETVKLGIDVSYATTTTYCSRAVITNSGTASTSVPIGTLPAFDLEQSLNVTETTKVVVTCQTGGRIGSDSVDILIKEQNEF